MRDPSGAGNYEGIVNNGYYTTGSWEIRMGREMSGTSLGGGVITEGHDEAWDVSGLPATSNVWHHVVLVYDSDTVTVYLDGERTTDEADHGDILTRNTDVFIGQAGTGSAAEYFTGLIDEVKIFGRSLSHDEVLDIFRSTPHNGGHCENGADSSHCTADGFDYCDAASVRQVTDIGAAAMGTLGRPDHESSRLDSAGASCDLDSVLAADGMPAGLTYTGSTYAVLDGHAVTSCMELAWDEEVQASGIRFAAAASDEPMCGASDSCSGEYCGTGGNFNVFTSGAERAGLTDYTTFFYQGAAEVAVDTTAGNGVSGQMLFDELSFSQGDQAVQYLAICRTGAGGARDNILFDWIALRSSQRDYEPMVGSTGGHCDPRPPPPPPSGSEFISDGLVFSVNSFDGNSWDEATSTWRNYAGFGLGSAPAPTAHFVESPLPAHMEFDGAQHFTFDHPESFDFAGDFTVQTLVKPPPNLEPFHFVLSRRTGSDYLSHHHIFIDTRSTWVGDWLVGEPVAVMYMGAGNAAAATWAYTNTIAVGDYVQLAFTVRAGVICGFVNGQRSGDCSANTMLDAERQMDTGEPLEVGGEDSYNSHPLWNLASVMYWDRHLTEEEVQANYVASQCLELETSCP